VSAQDADEYSEVAFAQIEAYRQTADDEFWSALIDALDLVFQRSGEAQSRSQGLVDQDGDVVFRLAITDHEPHQVFWRSTPHGPRVEAVFPYDR